MADHSTIPARKPLRVPDGMPDGTDGYRIVKPDDSDYEENYARARRDFTRFGIPMPYADTSEPPA